MLRDLQEISDGKIYGCNDMVRAACGDCAGCHACCEKMGTSIVLDPCDIWRLTTVTGKNFEQLLADTIELQVVDGVILPNLRMDGEKEQCVFLNEQGRCRFPTAASFLFYLLCSPSPRSPFRSFSPRLIGIFHNNINKITIIITIAAVFLR